MRLMLVLGAVLLSVALRARAAPTDCSELPVPSEETPCDTAPTVGYRKETLDTVNKDSSVEKTQSKTKSKEKVKVIQLKNGGTKTVVVDTSRTKTKKDSVSDSYSQTNHTLTENGLEDSTSLTQDKQHHEKEVDTVKKKAREVIITDKYGNVVSDTKKEKVKEKTKKKATDKQTQSLVHTVKQVPPPADTCDTPPPPTCDTPPPTCETPPPPTCETPPPPTCDTPPPPTCDTPPAPTCDTPPPPTCDTPPPPDC